VAGLGLRQRAPIVAIKLARSALANTPAQRLPLVGWAYRKTVAAVWGDRARTVDFRGLRLTAPVGDHVFTAGLIGGFYESIELDLFERLAAASRDVIDVGANIGIYACVGAAHLPAGGRLTAFEPVPANLALLTRNLAQNALSGRVTVEPRAVGEASGATVIHLASGSGNHSLAAEVTGGGHGALPVRVTSLSDHLSAGSPVDLLKVDVEGYDGYVLRGAARPLHEYRPTLLVEFVPKHLRNAGFPPGELLDIIFAAYRHVFAIDEPRGRLRRCTRDRLARYAGREVNLNLVAAANPTHVEIIENHRQSARWDRGLPVGWARRR
jgi:FkbM family methyltransferase